MPIYQTEAAVVLYTLFFDEEEEAAQPLIIRPKNVTWRRNSVRAADEATIEFDARAFAGLDPRALYSMRVEVYAHDVRGRPGYVLTDDPAARRFVGFVDKPSFNRDGDSDIIRLECRDYTSLFIDRQMPKDYVEPSGGGQRKFVPTDWSLDMTFYTFVQRIIGALEGEADLFRDAPGDAATRATVGVGAAAALGGTLGLVGGSVGSTAGTTLGTRAFSFRRRLYVEPDVAEINLKQQFERENLSDIVKMDGSLWDVLNQVSDLLGVVPTIDLDWMLIQRPSDFTRRIYHFGWGRNVSDLELTKNLNGGVSKKVFEVRALRSTMAPGQPRVVIGVWPKTNLTHVLVPVQPQGGGGGNIDDPSNAARGGSPRGKQNRVVDDVVVRYLLDGDYTEEQLTAIARTYYEEAARQDLQGTLSSREARDLGLTEQEELRYINQYRGLDGPTLLGQLTSGGFVGEVPTTVVDDLLTVTVEASPAEEVETLDLMAMKNSHLLLLDLPPAPFEATRAAEALIVGEALDLTALLQRSQRVAEDIATTLLYVKEAEHTWTVEDGYTIKVTFTSILGTDVGGPTQAAPTTAAAIP